MSAPSEGLSATKPVSAWNQPLEVQFKDLFKALGKAAVHGAVGKWDSGARDLVDAASAVGLKEQPKQLAWLLIFRSVAHAVDELVEERRDLLRRENRDLEGLADEIDLSLEEAEVTIDRRFFEHPRSLALLDHFQQPLTEWLIGAGFQKAEAEDVAQRLPTYFVFALNQEWRTAGTAYSRLHEAFLRPPCNSWSMRSARNILSRD